MSSPSPNNFYSSSTGKSSTDVFISVLATVDPSPSDINYRVQKRWINTATFTEFMLVGFTSFNGQIQANWISLSTTGGTDLKTLTGNSGGAVSPNSSRNINVLGDATSINVSGNPGTHALTANVILPAAHDVLVSNATSIVGVAPSGASGVPLISQGAAADPVFGTATVPGGGTGDTSFAEILFIFN